MRKTILSKLVYSMVAIILVLSLVSSASADPSDPWWNNDWSFRTPLTVTGASATDGVQAQVTVAYDSDMQTDFADLRFVQTDGVTTVPYWIESKIDGTSATVWLKLPANAVTVYQYYGNAGAVSASDGDAVFILFDGFDGSSLDTSTWTLDYTTGLGSATVANGELTLATSGTSGTRGRAIKSVATFTRPYVFEYRATLRSASAAASVVGAYTSGNTDPMASAQIVGGLYTIAAGGCNSLALTADGEVVQWGTWVVAE